MSIHWWPREELKENRETIEQINRRLGYRIQLKEIRWPAEVALGDRSSWKPRGRMRGSHPAMAVVSWR